MESDSVDITLGQVFELAQKCHQSGNIAQAMQFYEMVVEAVPEHSEALHFLGVLKHQVSDSEAGLEMVRKSIELAPDNASFHNNLGNLLREMSRHDEADSAYRDALAINPEDASVLCNVASSLRRLDKNSEAVDILQKAIAVQPEHGESHHNLGNIYRELKRFDEAIDCFEKAVKYETYKPATGGSLSSLANMLRLTGRQEEAEQVLRVWQQKDPDNPAAAHLLAAFTGTDIPERASDAYVVQSFQAYADSFDDSLAHLGYQAPKLIGAQVNEILPQAASQFSVCDLGCGTGLVAEYLKPFAKKLVGIDLSVNMLRKAKERQIYDNLYEVELGRFLQHTQAEFDVMVSVDTLCYLGDLEHAIYQAYSALKPQGWLFFTVEQLDRAEQHNYVLAGNGRYTHSKAYLGKLLQGAGFIDLSFGDVVLRKEAGDPVKGWLVSAQSK